MVQVDSSRLRRRRVAEAEMARALWVRARRGVTSALRYAWCAPSADPSYAAVDPGGGEEVALALDSGRAKASANATSVAITKCPHERRRAPSIKRC